MEKTINDELESLKKNNTWKIVEQTKGKNSNFKQMD